MALLRLVAAWRLDVQITVLTVDHGLRRESAEEARQVAAWSAGEGLPHVTLVWPGPKPASGVQAKARAARYDLMTGWCRENGAGWLLTAHTLDDQAETVLMRLSRTTSFESLAGIPEVGEWKGVGLFRPLLGDRRETLRGYLRGLGQPWIDDPSNDDERFERVRIRKALPVLRELGVTADGLSRFANEARAVSEGLAAAAAAWCGHHIKGFDEGYCLVPLADFQTQPDAIRSRILGRLVAAYGSGQGAEPAELALLSAWAGGVGSRRTLGGALIGRRRDHLIIGREPGRIGGESLIVRDGGIGLWDHRFEVRAAPGSRITALGTGRLNRVKSLPAFVQNALPAVELPDGSLCVPHLGVGEGATARFRAGLAG
jgi:tRNA(Ile)-lysidine synthase